MFENFKRDICYYAIMGIGAGLTLILAILNIIAKVYEPTWLTKLISSLTYTCLWLGTRDCIVKYHIDNL